MRMDDVGDDPQAAEETTDDVDLLPLLEAAGFQRVTLVRAWANEKTSNVSTLLRSSDATTFGEAERKGSLRETWLRTILEDGTLVETRLAGRGWLQVLLGPLRLHHPRAGYHFAQVAEVESLWPVHQERVGRIAAAREADLPRHDGLPLYRQLTDQATRVTMVQWQGMVVLTILPIIALAAFSLATGHEVTAPMLYGAIGAGALLGRFVGRQLMTLLPFPRPGRPPGEATPG
jgi:hypothetical protein